MENLIKMDDLGVPLILETRIYTPEKRPSQKEISASNYQFPGANCSLKGGYIWSRVAMPPPHPPPM